MNRKYRRPATAICCTCLSSVILFSGCQLQQALQRFTASTRPEDPSYLLDPATEARQLAAMSSQTRDDLNAFTDRSANQVAAPAQASQDTSLQRTAGAYLAQSTAAQSDIPAAAQSLAASREHSLPPEQSDLTNSGSQADTSYSGLSKYAVSASAQHQSAAAGLSADARQPGSSAPVSAVTQASGIQQTQPADGASTAAELHIRGITPGAGPVRIALFDSASSFPNRNAAQHKFSVDSSAPQINAPLTTTSRAIAVAVFQDLNNDGKLNRSAFGIPTEPYGFSGANSRSLGPPSFAEAAVQPRGSVEVLLTK